MIFCQFLEVHLIELIAGQNKYIIKVMIGKVVHRLSDSIGCSLVPLITGWCLFSCQNIHKPMSKQIEIKGIFNMLIEGSRIKLGKDKHAPDT